MLTLIIKDNGEPNVIKFTYENIYNEIKDIPGAEIVVSEHWLDALDTKNRLVCLLEPDCLVNSGYFASQLGLFKKNKMFRKLSMMSSATGVNDWANKFFGYSIGNNYSDGITPVKQKKSSSTYAVQVGYVPGAVIRTTMLKKALKDIKATTGMEKDLVRFSIDISFAFWRMGDGNPVYINPNATYVTTETYVNDIGHFDPKPGDLADKFASESI
jgi:hypothetical protein